MLSIVNQLRLVLRRLMHAPLFTLVAVTMLAVGIGANCAIFTVIDGVLLKPLPFTDPDRLVSIWYKAPGLGIANVNQGPAFNFLFRDENRVFEDVGMWNESSVSVTGVGEPERLQALRVTDGVFPILGIPPMFGCHSVVRTISWERPRRRFSSTHIGSGGLAAIQR